jgi:hypothetical protein
MSTPTQPTRHLCGPKPAKYVPASHQNTDGILARWNWQRNSENAANYLTDFDMPEPLPAPPVDGDEYQREQINEHAGRKIPRNW